MTTRKSQDSNTAVPSGAVVGSAPVAAPTADPVRALQLQILPILKEFQRVCDEHSLRYYLVYGSLLGAVRHKGFIPWDDDVDVGMPRPDYDRFSEICRTELGGGYSWHTYLTDRGHPWMWGKLMRDDTELRQVVTEHMSIQQSVYIDVWPLDGVPDRTVLRVMQRAYHKWCQIRLSADLKRPGIRGLVARSMKIVPRRLTISLCERMARRFRYDDGRIVVHPRTLYGYHKECMPREWFGEGERLQFEDMLVPGPLRWHEYLTHVYKDYMKLPPEAERVSRHETTAVRLSPKTDAAESSAS